MGPAAILCAIMSIQELPGRETPVYFTIHEYRVHKKEDVLPGFLQLPAFSTLLFLFSVGHLS